MLFENGLHDREMQWRGRRPKGIVHPMTPAIQQTRRDYSSPPIGQFIQWHRSEFLVTQGGYPEAGKD
jgi:hypothetical protein